MPDYFIVGQRGSGKGIVVVSKLRELLLRGNVVATNMDIDLVKLFPDKIYDKSFRPKLYRLPDVPSGDDILYLGLVQDHNTHRYFGKLEQFIACATTAERDYGALILDELQVWMNSRERGEKAKERLSFFKLLPLTRKLGWSTYFTSQTSEAVDKQVRDLLEYKVSVFRTDRMALPLPIPILGFLIKMLIKALSGGGFLPRFHIASVVYKGEFVESWKYRGSKEVMSAYNTKQFYSDSYEHGTYMLLPPSYYVDPVLPGEPSFLLYNGVPRQNRFTGVKEPSKLFDWPGRPSAWSSDAPCRLPAPISNPLMYFIESLIIIFIKTINLLPLKRFLPILYIELYPQVSDD